MLLVSGRAHGWIENTVVGHEARITLSHDGKAVVEQRLTLRTNGNERLKSYRLVGIDDDAEPLANAYVVPARDALSNSLASALPLKLEIVKRKNDEEGNASPTELDLHVDDARGLWRGEYVFVFRYGTDLRARQRIAPDGAMLRVEWHGPILDAGLTSVRAVFLVPASPTAPRPFEGADREEGDLEPNVISEVRRGDEHDELDLLRTYAPEKHSIVWAIRVDQRALEAPPKIEAPSSQAGNVPERLARGQLGIAVLLFAGYFLLVWLRAREVRRHAAAAGAIMKALIPFPDVVRALLAALALSAGVALEIVLREPLWGALCVVAACALAAYGAARIDPKSARRGPGRWLTVTDREVFGKLPRLRGAVLDVSTWAGKAMLLLLMSGVGVGCWWLSRRSPSQALLIGFDSVALLAVFGTG
ncbi:MAG TPA: hypothetical protein VFB62_00975, partial [Polyangiaceae bacterium]|nr:hypothetical protein [Polyangiaceae bacterium]